MIAAFRVPGAWGVKVICRVQRDPAAKLGPQSLVWAKSLRPDPENSTFLIVNVAPPVLVSKTLCGELDVSTSCFPNDRLDADRLAMACAPFVPVPRPDEELKIVVPVPETVVEVPGVDVVV